MTIHLPENLERPIRAAVESGRYASLADAMTEAASLLVERLQREQAQDMEITRRAVAEMNDGQGRPAAAMLADMQGIIDAQRRQ